MERPRTPLVTAILGAAKASDLPVAWTLTGIAITFVAFLWLLVVSPAIVPVALAIAAAVAWCIWLEGHPDA